MNDTHTDGHIFSYLLFIYIFVIVHVEQHTAQQHYTMQACIYAIVHAASKNSCFGLSLLFYFFILIPLSCTSFILSAMLQWLPTVAYVQ